MVNMGFVNSKSKNLTEPKLFLLHKNERHKEYRYLLGSSHHTADLAVREKISLPQGKIDDFYKGLVPCGLDECLLLNTCNRTEIYGASNNGFSPDLLRKYLSEFRNLDPDFLQKHSYQHSGEKWYAIFSK